jgi:hypothetical protein
MSIRNKAVTATVGALAAGVLGGIFAPQASAATDYSHYCDGKPGTHLYLLTHPLGPKGGAYLEPMCIPNGYHRPSDGKAF